MRLEVGDKIDLFRGGELQLILTVQEVNDNTVKAVARNGYVSRFRRVYEGTTIKNADPMADNGYLHTGQAPEHLPSEQSKERYFQRLRELGG